MKSPIFALLTPFDSSGAVDFPALRDYLKFLETARVPSVIVSGTTGEFPSLSLEERRSLLEFCRAEWKGGLMYNVSTTCVQTTRRLIEEATGLADSLLVLPPYYYAGAPEHGLLAFYRAVLEGVEQSVYFYNFPKHTNNPLTPSIVRTLASEFPSLRGIKDSRGEPDAAVPFKNANEGFQVFIGGDTIALESLSHGFAGFITGGGNPIPEYLVQLSEAFERGETDRAAQLQETYNTWSALRKSLGFPDIPVAKVGMSVRIPGFPSHVRPPLPDLPEPSASEVREFIHSLALESVIEES